jgi:hypothetical protein
LISAISIEAMSVDAMPIEATSSSRVAHRAFIAG